jgi:hypothetical protein
VAKIGEKGSGGGDSVVAVEGSISVEPGAGGGGDDEVAGDEGRPGAGL